MFRTITALAALTLAACSQTVSDASDLTPETPPPAPETSETTAFNHNDYTDMVTWLCHPDKADDACAIDLTATQIAPDGTTTIIPFEAATNPAFDCFYIYPTVSMDRKWNSDMKAGREEFNAVKNQFARYGAACRLFAPMYRQRTIMEMQTMIASGQNNADTQMRYADIKDSWDTYMRDHNKGRGVVLIGHSQGARMVFDLLEGDILDMPAQDQLIAVHAIGLTKPVDPVSGGFKTMTVCASSTDTGCLINFESFRATTPPPETSFFGKASDQGRAICTNPSRIEGQDGQIDAYMPSRRVIRNERRDYGAIVDTPFVTLPGLLSAACRSNDTHDWLAITVHADPTDARGDDIYGDVVVRGKVVAEWGLHVIDVNLVMGNLVNLAETQGAAWIAAHESE